MADYIDTYSTPIIEKVNVGGNDYHVADSEVRNNVGILNTNYSTLSDKVDALTSGGLSYKIVEKLPSNSEIVKNVVYLIKDTNAESGEYVEWLGIDKAEEGASTPELYLEQIGTTAADLEDYQKKITSATTAAPYGATKYLTLSNSDASLNVVKNASLGTTDVIPAKSIGTVLQRVNNSPSNGTMTEWNFTVEDGTLTISGSNGTAPTVPTFDTINAADVDTSKTVATYSAVSDGTGNVVTATSISTQGKATLTSGDSGDIVYVTGVTTSGTQAVTINT